MTGETFFFTLLRHGESVGNLENRYQGQTDYPLSERGLHQVSLLAAYWKAGGKRFDGILTSPLIRASETATVLGKELNCSILRTDPLLMERAYGLQSALEHDLALERFPLPDFTSLYRQVAETGESMWELYLRGGHALQNLLRMEPGHYLIVSHQGLLNTLLQAMLGLVPRPNFQGPRFDFGNTGYSEIRYSPNADRWDFLFHNAQPHLTTR